MINFIISVLTTIKSIFIRQCWSIRNSLFQLSPNEAAYTKFHSQFGEDSYLYRKLGMPKKGVFVDVGAGHPINLSNTYFFEKNGWTGLCVDADPTQVAELKKFRANVLWAAVAAEEGEIEFAQAVSPTFSSVAAQDQKKGILHVPTKETIKVPCYRLETILQQQGIGEIDLLSIDVEGLEPAVCESLDWEVHKPKVVVIEYYTFGLPEASDTLKQIFAKLPYRLAHTTCANLIFVRK